LSYLLYSYFVLVAPEDWVVAPEDAVLMCKKIFGTNNCHKKILKLELQD